MLEKFLDERVYRLACCLESGVACSRTLHFTGKGSLEIPLPFQHFNVALFSANYAITEDGGFPASSLKIKINESRTIVKAKLSTIMRYEQKILSKRGIQLVL